MTTSRAIGPLSVLLLALSLPSPAAAAVLTVAPSGGDYTSVQAALDAAVAGDTVRVRQGVYFEKIVFPRSGDAGSGFISRRKSAPLPFDAFMTPSFALWHLCQVAVVHKPRPTGR